MEKKLNALRLVMIGEFYFYFIFFFHCSVYQRLRYCTFFHSILTFKFSFRRNCAQFYWISIISAFFFLVFLYFFFIFYIPNLLFFFSLRLYVCAHVCVCENDFAVNPIIYLLYLSFMIFIRKTFSECVLVKIFRKLGTLF